MREWLKIRLALCQIERALSALRLPGYTLEEQVCGRNDLMALRVASMAYTPERVWPPVLLPLGLLSDETGMSCWLWHKPYKCPEQGVRTQNSKHDF